MNIFTQEYKDKANRRLTISSVIWANKQKTAIIAMTAEHGEVGLTIEDGDIFAQVVGAIEVQPMVYINAPTPN